MSIGLHPELRPRINGAIVPVLNTPLCRAHGRFTFAFNLPIIPLSLHFSFIAKPFLSYLSYLSPPLPYHCPWSCPRFVAFRN